MPTLLKEMVLQALDNAGGVDYLRRMAEKQPAAFLGLLGKILPTQLTGEGGGPIGLDVMTPEERAARARATIAEAFAPLLPKSEGGAFLGGIRAQTGQNQR